MRWGDELSPSHSSSFEQDQQAQEQARQEQEREQQAQVLTQRLDAVEAEINLAIGDEDYELAAELEEGKAAIEAELTALLARRQ